MPISALSSAFFFFFFKPVVHLICVSSLLPNRVLHHKIRITYRSFLHHLAKFTHHSSSLLNQIARRRETTAKYQVITPQPNQSCNSECHQKLITFQSHPPKLQQPLSISIPISKFLNFMPALLLHTHGRLTSPEDMDNVFILL
jgi:hypothetical protein